MKNLMTLFLVSGAILLTSCGNHESHEQATVKEEKKENSTAVTSPEAVKLKDEKLNAVYQHYIHLTNALISADAAEAKIAANAIEAGAKEIPGAGSVATSSAKIVTAKDIEAQRNEYSNLSNKMIELVKNSGLSTGEIYVDYCPMAMNDKGAYWLSNRKDIRNPYFGDKMMTCGEVKETLNTLPH